MPLIEALPDGPLDIVGDVHGEHEALLRLMQCLGYDEHCDSPHGRHLVFLGDLIDRGPDSPAVVDSVMSWVSARKASSILGNHELLALIGRPLHGNGWLIQPNTVEEPGDYHSIPAQPEQVNEFLEFFASLPVILENDRLRLVHACWHNESVDCLRQLDIKEQSTLQLCKKFEAELPRILSERGLSAKMKEELARFSVALEDPDWEGRVLPAHAEAEVVTTLSNPFRVLTSGIPDVAEQAFYAMGQWRMANRSKWWDSYDDEIPVVIGHFWRRFNVATERVAGVFGKDVFEGIGSHEWMGKRKNVYCVDYSVGQRHAERSLGSTSDQFHGKLAALRYPEWEVYHDDGSIVQVA